jgi:DNA-directed RNA polymerase subunit omega
LNTELLGQALQKISNPNILVNLVSRRVRQLNAGGRPLMNDTATMGMADVALTELVLDKMGWEPIADLPGEETPAAKRRRRG